MKKKRMLTDKEYDITASVQHWRFEDGERNTSPLWSSESLPRGWYCWVYPTDNDAIREWMERMCPSADITHRFNSGNPMWTVYIEDDKDATLFQLKWL